MSKYKEVSLPSEDPTKFCVSVSNLLGLAVADRVNNALEDHMLTPNSEGTTIWMVTRKFREIRFQEQKVPGQNSRSGKFQEWKIPEL